MIDSANTGTPSLVSATSSSFVFSFFKIASNPVFSFVRNSPKQNLRITGAKIKIPKYAENDNNHPKSTKNIGSISSVVAIANKIIRHGSNFLPENPKISVSIVTIPARKIDGVHPTIHMNVSVNIVATKIPNNFDARPNTFFTASTKIDKCVPLATTMCASPTVFKAVFKSSDSDPFIPNRYASPKFASSVGIYRRTRSAHQSRILSTKLGFSARAIFKIVP